MRKRLALGTVAVVLSALGGSWYCGWWQQSGPTPRGTPDLRVSTNRVTPTVKDDGVAEAADTIEPLVVENSVPAPVVQTSLPELEAPPVYWTPGMKQAPRPDAEPGSALRMPYLEEWTVVLPWPLEPLARILQGTALSKLKLFENLKGADPTEEAENKEVMPPVELPVPDYHHQYPSCPYTGGHCPAPYPYYPRR